MSVMHDGTLTCACSRVSMRMLSVVLASWSNNCYLHGALSRSPFRLDRLLLLFHAIYVIGVGLSEPHINGLYGAGWYGVTVASRGVQYQIYLHHLQHTNCVGVPRGKIGCCSRTFRIFHAERF